MEDLERFGRYLISQGANRSPLSFPRVPGEVVCLGYTPETDGLVEVHVVSESEEYNGNEKISFAGRTWTAALLAGPCFQKIIDVDESEGMLFYVTEVSDGEPLSDYLRRTGPMDPPLALALTIELTDSIVQLQQHKRLLHGLSLSNLLAVLSEGASLTLRILDLGLARRESRPPDDFDTREPMRQISELLFLLLTGRAFDVARENQIEQLVAVPSDLKFLLRRTLGIGNADGPESLEEYRSILRHCLGDVAKRITSTSKFKPLAIAKNRYPQFALWNGFFSQLDPNEELGGRYRIKEDADRSLGPYELLADEVGGDKKYVIQMLPPPAVLPLRDREQVQMEMNLLPAGSGFSLLKAHAMWETERAAFIAEECVSGFSLPAVLIARDKSLEPDEVLIVLRSVGEALDEAAGAGVPVRNLTIHSIQFHFPTETPMRTRNLRERHIDCWPEFQLKLRCHPSLASALTMAPIGRIETDRVGRKERNPEALVAKAYVGIAEHLVLGPWPPADSEAEEIDSELREFFRLNYEKIDAEEGHFDRPQFLAELKERLGEPEPAVATIVDGGVSALPSVIDPKLQERDEAMQSVGENGSDEIESLGSIDDDDFTEPVETADAHNGLLK